MQKKRHMMRKSRIKKEINEFPEITVSDIDEPKTLTVEDEGKSIRTTAKKEKASLELRSVE